MNNVRAVLLICSGIIAAQTALATDTLEHIRETGILLWGGDQEGGGPYVFPDPNDSSVVLGFEVDLANLIAEELSKQLSRPVVARMAQGQWDMLPSLLTTHRVDVILNGYEATKERSMLMQATRPYYIYTLQLLARSDNPSIHDWESFNSGKPKKIGVLGGSSAERFLLERFTKNEVEVVLYDGNTNAMMDVERGRIDATIQDTPIAVFYAKDFPSLRFVGSPVSEGYYVMFGRKEDHAFVAALNLAIAHLIDNGALKKCYEKYGIWNNDQGRLKDAEVANLAFNSSDDKSFLQRHGWVLVEAAGMTLLLSFASMPIAILLGIFIALLRLYGPRWLAILLRIYVELIRGTPLLLQLLFIFYLIPAFGINLHPVVAAIVGLAMNYSAYEAEIYRAGLIAVPKGQMEAALTLGMSRTVALRRIVLPQAFRIVLPPVTNDFIALFKDTSVCSVVTVVELAKRYNIAVMSNPADLVPLAVITALLYLGMSFPLSILSRHLEAKTKK